MAAQTSLKSQLDGLKVTTKITDEQLDSRIKEDKLWEVAGLLGNYEQYVGRPGFGLNESEIADLGACAKENGNQFTMKKAFKKWFDVTRTDKTTYRSLVKILIKLRKITVAEKVCITGELFNII